MTTPAEAGRALALEAPPITEAQAEAAAHILVLAERSKVAAA